MTTRQTLTNLGLAAALGISGLAYASEARACGSAARPQHVMQHDTNGDARVDRAELTQAMLAKARAKLEMLDTNRDGFVDQTEREVAHQARKAERAERRAAREAGGDAEQGEGERMHRKHRGEGGKHRGEGHARVEIDTDGDGRWALAELEAAAGQRVERMMERLDFDKDGVIDAGDAAHRAHAHKSKRG